MKKFFEYTLPILAGVAIAYFVLPQMGGNLDILLQKTALDWEIPVMAMRAIVAVALALILCFIFGLVARVAVWLAVVLILLSVFAPALLKDAPIVSEDVKNFVTEQVEKLGK